MSLHELTVKDAIQSLLAEYYKEGRIPRPVEFEAAINALLEKYPPGQPRLKLRPQERKTKLNLEAFNQQTTEIGYDLNLLYKALIDVIERSTTYVASAQGVSSIYDAQLEVLKDKLDTLIATHKNAGSYLLSYTESFNNLSGIDQNETTATVDIENRVCTLRRAAKGTTKVILDHMIQSPTNTTVVEPFYTILNGKDVTFVGSTPFSSCISSVNDQIFQRTYTADPSGGQVTLRIEFPVQSNGDLPRISRIDIAPLGSYKIRVFYTNENREDRANWLYFPGFEGTKKLDRATSFTFEDRDVAWIRLEMVLEVPSKVTSNLGQYQFAIEELAFFKQGYANTSTLQTEAFEPDGAEALHHIGKVSLSVQERPMPSGTDIKYYIQLQEDDSPWVAISPVNKPTQDTASRIVDFGGRIVAPRKDNRFRVTTPTLYERRNGISFYTIKQLGQTPEFGTVRLFPTIGAWKQSETVLETTRTVSNNYVVFTQSDSDQPLYVTRRDESPKTRQVDALTYLDVQEEIVVQDGMQLIPPGNQSAEQNPYYSIERILRLSRTSFDSGTTGDIVRRPALRPELNTNTTLSNPTSYIRQFIYLADGTYTGYFRILDTYQNSSDLTVFILEDVGELYGQGTITWRLDVQDVSDRALSVSGRSIQTNIDYSSDDRYLITYRHRLNNNQSIVEGSVRLRVRGFAQDARDGIDYGVDYQNKTVRRLSDSINQGAGTTVFAIASYQLKESVPDVSIYSTYVTSTSRQDLTLRPIAIDRGFGEQVSLLPVTDTSLRTIDDISSGGKVTVSGMMQFVVRSKPLRRADGSVDTGSAIYKLINAKDATGNYIFDLGRYFDRMEAVAEPMEQVTYTRIGAISPTDYNKFAVLSDNNILLNHDPTKRRDIFILLPGQTTEMTYRDMEVGYTFSVTNSSTKQLKLRAVLTRSRETPGTVTPTIESFTIRYS